LVTFFSPRIRRVGKRATMNSNINPDFTARLPTIPLPPLSSQTTCTQRHRIFLDLFVTITKRHRSFADAFAEIKQKEFAMIVDKHQVFATKFAEYEQKLGTLVPPPQPILQAG